MAAEGAVEAKGEGASEGWDWWRRKVRWTWGRMDGTEWRRKVRWTWVMMDGTEWRRKARWMGHRRDRTGWRRRVRGI